MHSYSITIPKDQISDYLQHFLLFKTSINKTDEIIDSKQHCNAFCNWLKLKGIQSYRSDIVMCIAEKTNTMIPGMYDAYDFN